MIKKIVVCLLLLASTVALAANVNQSMVRSSDINYWVMQAGHGKPTIILLTGAGEAASAWDAVVPGLSKLSSVFSYDRAGLGNSESLPDLLTPRTAKSIVQRLRTLLQRRKVSPPYVLVSNGLGSSYARYFARNFPTEVKALLLINPDVNAAIALGEIKSYGPGQGTAQVEFRKVYRHNQFNAQQNLINYVKSAGKLNVTFHQAAIIAQRLERLGASKSEQQILASPPLKTIPMIIMEGKQNSALETNMLKQLAAEAPKGHYEYIALNSDELKKIAPEKIIAAVKQVLR